MAKIINKNGTFFFDAEDGTAQVELKTWLETSKKNEAHPDGKMWIKLPKNNVTNRQYFSLDLFNSTALINDDGDLEVIVPVKDTPARVLGSSTVAKSVVDYLDPDQAAEYTELVETAVEAFKEAKANSKKKKPEDMTREELEAYIECLRAGTKYTVTGPKSYVEMFTEEQYVRFTELQAIAMENKANRPKATRTGHKLTDEEKAVRAEKRAQKELSKAEALLAALQAKLGDDFPVDEDED